MFPNPVNDVLHVLLPTGYSTEDLRVIDVLGRSMPVELSNGTIVFSGLTSGTYILRIKGPSGQLTARVLKN